jgi:ABC-type lipoprotein release transport system permease subunit
VRSLLQTRTSFARAHGLADLEIRLLPEDLRKLPDWTGVPGVERVEERLLVPGVVHRAAGPPVNALMVFLRHPQPTINRLVFREGRGLSDEAQAEAVVERSALEWQGIGVGQQLEVKAGNQLYTQEVVGVAASPEFLVVAANPEYFLPEKGSLVVVYTSLDRVYETVGFRMVNDLLFRFAPGTDAEATTTAVLAALGARQLERIIPRAEHISWRHISVDVDVLRIYQPAIDVVLPLLAAGLVVVTFDRLVRRQRAELGAVKAIGYSGAALVRAYVLASVCLTGVAVVPGVLGAAAFRSAFLWIYADAHGLAYLEQLFSWPVLLTSLLTILLIAVGSAIAATWRLWKLSALQLLRASMEQPVDRGRIAGQLPESWPMPIRLAMLNLVRAPRMTVFTILGVAATVSVGAAYLVCLDSMEQAIVRTFDIQRWQSAVSFLYPVVDEDYQGAIAALPGARAEGFVRSQGILEHASDTAAVSLLGVKSSGSLYAVNLVSGRMPQGADEIVIGADLARRLRVSAGSALDLRIRADRRRVAVVGVKSDVVPFEAIMSLAALQRLLELEEQATGMFVAVSPPGNAAAAAEQLREVDFVGRVTGRGTLVAEFVATIRELRKIVMLVAAVALLVAIVFIVANLSMAVSEQATEFSTLWALGYTRATARRIVMVNGLVQTAFALVLAMPLTAAIAGLLNAMASRAWFDQPTFISPLIPLLVGSSVVTLTVIATHVAFGRFWQSSLLDNLRARAIQ